MTATSGFQLAVGTRFGVAFALDSNGYPAATSASTAYEGIQFEGAKAFSLTVPSPKGITHFGDDRVLAVDFLPPTEAATAELTTAKGNMTLDALLSGVLAYTVGESKQILRATDKQGFEPTVGLLLFQQSLDAQISGAASGLRRWRGFIVPRAQAIPMTPGMGDSPQETKYALSLRIASKHIWGTAFATNLEGALEGQFAEIMTEGKPKIVAWIGDAAAVAFSFPASYPAYSTAKVKVWKNGVLETPSSVTTTTITLSAAPATGAMVVAFYEY